MFVTSNGALTQTLGNITLGQTQHMMEGTYNLANQGTTWDPQNELESVGVEMNIWVLSQTCNLHDLISDKQKTVDW